MVGKRVANLTNMFGLNEIFLITKTATLNVFAHYCALYGPTVCGYVLLLMARFAYRRTKKKLLNMFQTYKRRLFKLFMKEDHQSQE